VSLDAATLIDSHVHLDDEQFRSDLEGVFARAREQRITRMLTIGTGDGPPKLDCAVEIASRFPGVSATVGVHPHEASKVDAGTFDQLRGLLREPSVVALGEIGLDYHYDLSPREAQREVFAEQMRIAREAKKPIIIHTREAWADTVELIRREWRGPGIVHCFTGDEQQAREALDLGFLLAFGGMVTFKTAEAIRQAAAIVPDDRLLVETDAPYLAPIPYRGKRNEPAFMIETVRKLAEIRGTSVERIAEITTANFDRLMFPGAPFAGETGEQVH
jgi:TatD DNase family protein